MIVLGTIQKADNPNGHLILLGYEVVEDPTYSYREGYLGIYSDAGDDLIFAFEASEGAIWNELCRRWSHWDTFDVTIPTVTDEEYWNELGG